MWKILTSSIYRMEKKISRNQKTTNHNVFLVYKTLNYQPIRARTRKYAQVDTIPLKSLPAHWDLASLDATILKVCDICLCFRGFPLHKATPCNQDFVCQRSMGIHRTVRRTHVPPPCPSMNDKPGTLKACPWA